MVGGKDNYINITRPTIVEDAYGDLTQTSAEVITSFWAEIQEVKPKDNATSYDEQRARFVRTLNIICDERDAINVDIEDHVSIDNQPTTWQVINKFEHEWKFKTTLLIQYKQ